MKLLAIFICIILTTPSHAQYSPFKEAYDLQKKIPKGKKVYVTAEQKSISSYAAGLLTDWGYWQIVPTQKEAAYTVKFYTRKNKFRNWSADAEFKDSVGNVVTLVYILDSDFSALMGGSLFNKKRAAILKLVKRRITAGA